MDIRINKPTGAIVKEAVIENLPDFVIITGENGTGKTQFLSYLYLRSPNLIANFDSMMFDQNSNANPGELGEYQILENGESKFTPFLEIFDGQKLLNNIIYRSVQIPTVDLGYHLNVSNLISIGKKFAHKYTFYKIYKGSLSDEGKNQINTDTDTINLRYLEEIGIIYDRKNPRTAQKLFTTEDKNIIERIITNHPHVNIEHIPYYHIIYKPNPNSKLFSVNLGFLFIQHWAKKKVGIPTKDSPLDVFNQVAKEAGFRYTLQEPTISENANQVIIKLLDNEKGGIIDINSLSSGEKVILSLVLAIYTSNTDAEFPEMILFDEPDAFLHPSMSKFMLDVMQNIFVKEKKIKVIVSTHSPSTVALAPEESLYRMDRELGGIVKARKNDAISLLTDGIFTFEEGIESFKLIKRSSKQNILCVEGKTDVMHIQAAMRKLNRNIDIEIANLHNAESLCNFVKSVPVSILGNKKIIGLFDNDIEGRKKYNEIKGNIIEDYKKLTSEQSNEQAYVCCIPSADPKMEKYLPIEFLYSKEILDKFGLLNKRSFIDFKNLYKSDTLGIDEDRNLNEEFASGDSLRVFKITENRKVEFAKGLDQIDSSGFNGFNPLLNLIEKIIDL